jgi:hypothetical protein
MKKLSSLVVLSAIWGLVVTGTATAKEPQPSDAIVAQQTQAAFALTSSDFFVVNGPIVVKAPLKSCRRLKARPETWRCLLFRHYTLLADGQRHMCRAGVIARRDSFYFPANLWGCNGAGVIDATGNPI